MSRILLVDDDPTVAIALRHWRDVLHFEFHFDDAADVAEAANRLNACCYDAALIDYKLPGVSGDALICAIREWDREIPLAYFTGIDHEAVRVAAVRNRAIFLSKSTFLLADDLQAGMHTLLAIIAEMGKMNPCKEGSRIDAYGFPRKLPRTPLELRPSLIALLEQANELRKVAVA